MAKARTAAQKRKSKRGRPRQEGPREPSGRISRSGIDNWAEHIAPVQERARRLGISEKHAMDQKAGTFIGYLNLIGPVDGISDAQYDGAQQFLKLRQRAARALQSPAAIYDPEAIGGEGIDPEAYTEWCKAVLAEDRAVRRQVQEAQNYSRENLWAAIQYVIIEGKQMHNMIGATRIVCNVFARHFKMVHEHRQAA